MASEDMEGLSTEASPPSCIRLYKKGDCDQLLIAEAQPSTEFPVGIAAADIHAWILGQGCGEWFLNQEAIRRLSMEIRKLASVKEYVLAERKDCRIELEVSPNRLQAWIQVTPAYGGAPLTEEALHQALEERHIRFGIHEARRARILEEGGSDRILIAAGEPPGAGTNARFEPLVHESDHKGIPQELKNGRVDYKELGLFLSVARDTPLLKKHPPTEGTPGTGVDGIPIPAPPGADRPLRAGSGTAISREDPSIVVAARVGQPVFDDNAVQVNPTLELPGVNPSTGNVDFDGSIIVHGSVEPGFTINAGQDLTILDTVEGSHLTAGRNIQLLTGVYGKGKTRLSAGGSIEARFLSDCTVRCGGNLDVADRISHCFIECDGAILMGRGGGKGQMLGGKARALREVQACILGSVSETATLLEIGPSQELLRTNTRVEKELTAAEQSRDTASRRLQELESDSPEPDGFELASLLKKVPLLTEKVDVLKKEYASIQHKLDISRRGRIRAAEAHRGVTLCIGPHRYSVDDRIIDLSFQAPADPPPASIDVP